MSAENCKIILLSGTPIINYPNEIAVLFNILRGYITEYRCKFSTEIKTKITQEYITKILKEADILKHVDLIEYQVRTRELKLIKNP